MAIYFATPTPQKLLDTFKKAIVDKKVATWLCSAEGDFTHDTDQWRHKAWLRPTVENGRLKLSVLKPQNATVSWEVFGIYQGRFIETMIIHCNELFSEGIASAVPVAGDIPS